MIIFDTNAVRLLNPSSDKADLIRKLRASGHGVAVPEMVLEEMIAQQVLRYTEAFTKAEIAFTGLQAATPEHLRLPAPESAKEQVRAHWREEYSRMFDLIPTTGDVARKALIREANAEKPAKRLNNDKVKAGARDVAIWLSVVDHVKDHPGEVTYFVTENSKDFGDGTSWPTPMDEDIEPLEGQLELLGDWDSVVARFTEAVDVTGGEEDVLRTADLRESLGEAVGQVMRNFLAAPLAPIVSYPLKFMQERPEFFTAHPSGPDAWAFQEYLAHPPKPLGLPAYYQRWLPRTVLAELVSIDNLNGHKIGDERWYTASARWLLVGGAEQAGELDLDVVALVWESRVLFSSKGQVPAVLEMGATSLPFPSSDESVAAAIKRLLARIAGPSEAEAGGSQENLHRMYSLLMSINRDRESIERRIRTMLDELP